MLGCSREKKALQCCHVDDGFSDKCVERNGEWRRTTVGKTEMHKKMSHCMG